MKKFFLFSILISSLIYAQSPKQNVLKLKSDSQYLTTSVNDNYSLNFQLGSQKKKVGLAILYSLLLPGMGELYAGDYSSGKYFTITDALLWGTYIGFYSYGNMRKSDYKSYAATYGGVNNNGKDDAYYTIIGNYQSIQQYNNEKALERNFNEMYNVDQYYWNWQNDNQRSAYKDMWTSSESAYNDLKFVAGALILNRVISMINAVRLVSAYNRGQNDELSWQVSVGVNNSPTLPKRFSFNFRTKF
jgi:hypothetical protein